MKGVHMSTEEVFERVKKVIIEQLGVVADLFNSLIGRNFSQLLTLKMMPMV